MEMLPTVEARHAPQLTDASTRKRVEDLKAHVAARVSSLYGPPQIFPCTLPETQPAEPAISILGIRNGNSVGYPEAARYRQSTRAHSLAAVPGPLLHRIGQHICRNRYWGGYSRPLAKGPGGADLEATGSETTGSPLAYNSN